MKVFGNIHASQNIPAGDEIKDVKERDRRRIARAWIKIKNGNGIVVNALKNIPVCACRVPVHHRDIMLLI